MVVEGSFSECGKDPIIIIVVYITTNEESLNRYRRYSPEIKRYTYGVIIEALLMLSLVLKLTVKD